MCPKLLLLTALALVPCPLNVAQAPLKIDFTQTGDPVQARFEATIEYIKRMWFRGLAANAPERIYVALNGTPESGVNGAWLILPKTGQTCRGQIVRCAAKAQKQTANEPSYA
jgi:hypothetical protein